MPIPKIPEYERMPPNMNDPAMRDWGQGKDYFWRLERSPRLVRWVTRGLYVRYAIVRSALVVGEAGAIVATGGIHWALVSRDRELERSSGCFYDDSEGAYGDGLRAVPRAVLAVRKVMRKSRAFRRELGLPHVPIVGRPRGAHPTPAPEVAP